MSKVTMMINNLRLQATRLEEIKEGLEGELGGDWVDEIDEAVDEVEQKVSAAQDELDARAEEADSEEEKEEDDSDFV